MPYVEFLPRPELAHLVRCVWNYAADATETEGRPERIVPDGNEFASLQDTRLPITNSLSDHPRA